MIDLERLERYTRHARRYGQVSTFVKQSNRIEGIEGASTDEVAAHFRLLDRPKMTTKALEEFVKVVQPDAVLRRKPGKGVVVTRNERLIHRAPEGGPAVARALTNLIKAINGQRLTPLEAHVEYETLHPFTDGNGRSGRALWVWQVQRQEPLRNPFALTFLHHFYYDALTALRDAAKLREPDQGS